MSNAAEEAKKRLLAKQATRDKVARNSPDTGEGNLLTRSAKAIGRQVFDDLESGAVMAGNALNTISGGGYGILDRAMGAGIKKLTGDERSFDDLMQEVAKERAATRAKHPKSSLAGDVMGGVVFGGKAAKALETIGVQLAKPGVRAAAGRVAGGSAAGAAENAAVEAGRGNIRDADGLNRSLRDGAIFGGAGQLVSEAVPPIAKWFGSHMSDNIAANRGLEQAGAGLMDPPGTGRAAGRTAAGRLGTGEKGFDADKAMVQIDQMRDDQVLGDLMDNVGADTTRVVGSESTTNYTQPLEDLSAQRIANQDVQAQSIMSDYLSPSTTKAGRAHDYQVRREAAGAAYSDMVDSDAAKAPSVPRDKLKTQFRRIFTQKGADLSQATATKDWLEKEVDEFMGAKKKGATNRENTSVKDLLNLKKNIDDRITSHYNGTQDNLDKQSIVYLTEVKNNLNRKIHSAMKAAGYNYNAIAGNFATNERERQIYQMGHDLFGKSAIEPSELSVIYNSLNKFEKERFLDGALSKLNSAAAGDGMPALKKALKANTMQRQKLEVLLPADRIDDFVRDADQFTKELDNAEAWQRAAINRNTAGSDGASPRNAAAHTAATVGSAATGRLNSAAYSLSHMLDPSEDQSIQSIMDLYQAQGPEAARNALNKLISASKRKPTNFSGAMIGSALGRTLMD